MDRASAEAVVTSRGWLAHQDEPFQHAWLARAVIVTFANRDHVFHSGDDGGGVYGVVNGGIGIYPAGRDGSVALGHVLRAGHWFGHGPAMTRRRRTLTFRATESSLAFFVPLAALNKITAHNIEFMRSVGAMLEFGIDDAISAVSDLLIRRSDQRIAATLLRVTGAETGNSQPGPDGYFLGQADLAEMANVSRDVINRTLARFKAWGWVSLGYNRIFVLDAVALSDFIAGNIPRLARGRNKSRSATYGS